MKAPQIIALCMAMAATAGAYNTSDTTLYREPYRPQYHFTPAHRWIGDPCGFIRHNGEYLGYSWGGARTRDLIHWQEFDNHVIKGMPPRTSAFTGSVVADTLNSAGWGKDALVAIFTLFDEDTRKQSQAIAYSVDGGLTYHYYDRNPVLDIWSTEFRDPTVIRHAPTGKWIMAVAKALEKKIAFYESDNLRDWSLTSEFGPLGDSLRSWECPDLFQVTVEETGEKKWVLVVSINWAREQYFIGDFDGKRFIPDTPEAYPLYIDDGLDFYASRVFQCFDEQDTAPITLGWVNYWDYAQHAPSEWGKGVWSLPRVYSLYTTPEGYRLKQTPVKALEELRDKEVTINRTFKAGTYPLPQLSVFGNQYELEVELSTSPDDVAGFNLCVGDGRKVSVSFDAGSGYLTVDRTNTSNINIPHFDRIANSRIAPAGTQTVKLRIYVDWSTVEIFAEDGKKVLTLLTYASKSQTGVEFFSQRGSSCLSLKGWLLKSSKSELG